jgi:hypothetical protein
MTSSGVAPGRGVLPARVAISSIGSFISDDAAAFEPEFAADAFTRDSSAR